MANITKLKDLYLTGLISQQELYAECIKQNFSPTLLPNKYLLLIARGSKSRYLV